MMPGQRALPGTRTVRAAQPIATSTLAAIWLAAVVGIAGGARVMWWYWPGSLFDGLTSSVWVGLAWDAAHGTFYRPLIGPLGYGGTRYMPMLFLLHSLFIRVRVDPIVSGIELMQASVIAAAVALYAAQRAADVPVRVAVPLSMTVWGTVIFQKYCTDMRADYLAAALALSSAAFAFGIRHGRRPLRRANLAAVLSLIAVMTKVTAIAFVAPIAIWLWIEGRRDLAVRYVLVALTTFVVAVMLLQVASRGNFLESFSATAAGGIAPADLALALPKALQEVLVDPPVAIVVILACSSVVVALRKRALGFAHLYFVTALVLTAVLFASPGVTSNQLVDLHLASVLLVGIAIGGRERVGRAAVPAYAAIAAFLAAMALPVPGMPSVMATLAAEYPQQRSSVRVVHDEFLADGSPYLSTDAIVPVLSGESPVMLDAFNLGLFVRRETPAGRDIARRVKEHAFNTIVLRDTPGFTADMTSGDPGFEEARARFWAAQSDTLPGLFHTAYELYAVRRPFAVLRPRRGTRRDVLAPNGVESVNAGSPESFSGGIR